MSCIAEFRPLGGRELSGWVGTGYTDSACALDLGLPIIAAVIDFKGGT